MSPPDPLSGRRWSVEAGDCLTWLAGLPDDCADLLFTSPPYEAARTYSIGFNVRGQAWVDWLAGVVKAAAPKVKGLIAVNCEGQTRGYKYSCVPFLLMADLHRTGFNLRKPVVFHRVGIPGSGGPDWLRNDWEPVVCVTRPGKLPWSDNTACGHPPKFGPGGEMSHRLSDGQRINQWGPVGSAKGAGNRFRHGKETNDKGPRPSHKIETVGEKKRRLGYATNGVRNGDTVSDSSFSPPVLANPGNVIRQTYTADEVAALLAEAGDVNCCNVGGNRMGHKLAHENEAPFPLALAEFFVRSFCPPGGIVLDPFCGSGSAGHAAVLHGRRFMGCDVRESQAELSRRRIESVTPNLFTEESDGTAETGT